MAHRKPKKAQDTKNRGHQRRCGWRAPMRRGVPVPEAELAAGAVQQVVEQFDQEKCGHSQPQYRRP
jgi:hypothetical protein